MRTKTYYEFFCVLLIMLIGMQYVPGQGTQIKNEKTQVTYATLLGKTKPIRHLQALGGVQEDKRASIKARGKLIPNFPGRRKHDHQTIAAPPFNEDPVRQTAHRRSSNSIIEPRVNVEGMDRAFAGPRVPDANGDIGKDYYIQVVNASFFQVFDKQGNAIAAPAAFNTIWASLGFMSAGDPIILYDQELDRWILTEFPDPNQLLIAISETGDPMGSYYAYNFATPRFPDYPKYGIWKNTLYATTNEEGPGVQHVYFLDRLALAAGDEQVMVQRIEIPGIQNSPGFMVATPVDWSGKQAPPADAEPMVMYIQDDAWGVVNQDQIDIYSFDVDFDNPDNTTFSHQVVPTAPFDSDACAESGFGFQCIPHPDGNGIDGLPWTIMHQTHYRNFVTHESIVLNFIVDATASSTPIAGIRWMELRRPHVDSTWRVYQEGTYAPDDSLHRFMGAIAIDGAGNIGLGYNIASADVYAGLRFTGRKAGDPLGEMTVQEYHVAEGFGGTQDDRFGDYSSMAVDPEDDRTFWFTGEYMKVPTQWGTRILGFQLLRDTIDMGPVALVQPVTSSLLNDQEIITADFKNIGLDTVNSFLARYQINNGILIEDSIQAIIFPDSIFRHQFTIPADLSTPGDYSIQISSSLAGDSNPGNDNLLVTVRHIPDIDLGIVGIGGTDRSVCDTETSISVEIQNFGADTLFNSTLNVFHNGTLITDITWNGSLALGARDTIIVPVTNLTNGINDFIAISSAPNGLMDEITANDTLMASLTAITDGILVTLELQPDRFPEEITWELKNSSDQVVASGGPYTSEDLIIEDWCLEQECHTFNIFDAAGDGICCSFGDGFYVIKDRAGDIIVESDGDYGDEESNTFCLEDCLVTAQLDITPESTPGAQDGVVMISAMNGRAPYNFSLDGGVTYQLSSLFSNLSSGTYNLAVRDRNNCIYRDTFEIGLCDLTAMITTTDESAPGANDGEIAIIAAGGVPPYQFSIDGGISFQSDSIFNNLTTASYPIIIQDANLCELADSVFVDLNVSVNQIQTGRVIKVYPNPNAGVFIIEIHGHISSDVLLPYKIFDNHGNYIQPGNLVRYDNVYTSEVSLHARPDGIYYVMFPGTALDRLIKIVKQ